MGSDEKNHKVTYVTLQGLEQSKKDVMEISMKAVDILKKYDEEDGYLTRLTQYLIERKK